MQKGVFYQMPGFIKFPVVIALLLSVSFGWNDRRHPPSPRLLKDFIGIVAPVRQKMLRGKSLNQGARLRAIRCCTLCNKSPDRHTMRIHGQMQFCVEPPFVRLIS